MAVSGQAARWAPLWRSPAKLFGPVALCSAAVAAAGLVLLAGLWSLLIPIYCAALFAAIAFPKHSAAALLVAGIVFEPAAIDFTKPISAALYSMPPGWDHALGLTISPIEVAVVATALSLVLRRSAAYAPLRLPLVVWAVPAVMSLGLLYGLYKGAPANLAYTELRGLLVAVAAFVIAARLGPGHLPFLGRAVVGAVAALAVIVLARYFFIVRAGLLDVPLESAFAHEGSLIFGIGLLVGGARLLHVRDARRILLMSGFCILVTLAMMATGRRAGTLVLLVSGVSFGLLLLPRRPVLVIAAAIPLLLMTGAYLAVYWNQDYGTIAQPARAIRSQFQPSSRDDSSDLYRTIEKYDVVETIRYNRVFGVGFGRPFIQFQQLPDLTSFWPLQSYTSHQSVLWLWLKMGWLGISVFLGLVVVVLSRCLERMRGLTATDANWTLAAVLFSGTLAFIVYATVDLGFAGSRSGASAAVLVALALGLRRSQDVQIGAAEQNPEAAASQSPLPDLGGRD